MKAFVLMPHCTLAELAQTAQDAIDEGGKQVGELKVVAMDKYGDTREVEALIVDSETKCVEFKLKGVG